MSAAAHPATGSPLARLKAALENERDAEQYVPIPVSKWRGRLVARITPVGPQAARENADRVIAEARSGYERDRADLHADTIAMFTTGLYWTEDDGVTLEPLPSSNVEGAVLRFDGEFGAVLGDEGTGTPRGAVIAAFTETVDGTPVLNVTALASLAGRIAQWVNDTSTEIAGRIVDTGS